MEPSYSLTAEFASEPRAEGEFKITSAEQLLLSFPQEFSHQVVSFRPVLDDGSTQADDDNDGTSGQCASADDGQFAADVRCNVGASDWEYWLEYFSKMSKTEWNTRHIHRAVSANAHTDLSRSYLCHHNSKTKNLQSKKHFHKGTGCEARLSVQVQRPTGRKMNDPLCRMYFESGLTTLIVIRFTHNHPIGTVDHIRFIRPTDDVRVQFETYFSEYGMSVAEAKRYHTELLMSQGCTVEDTNNPAINPLYRTVTHWYNSWKNNTHRAHINRALKRAREEASRALVGMDQVERQTRKRRRTAAARNEELKGDFSDENDETTSTAESAARTAVRADANSSDIVDVDDQSFQLHFEHVTQEEAVPCTSSMRMSTAGSVVRKEAVVREAYPLLGEDAYVHVQMHEHQDREETEGSTYDPVPTLSPDTQDLINDVQVLLYEKLSAFGSDWCTLALKKLKFRLNSVTSAEQLLDLLNIMASKVIQRRPRANRQPRRQPTETEANIANEHLQQELYQNWEDPLVESTPSLH